MVQEEKHTPGPGVSLTGSEVAAIRVALGLLADAIEDGNAHLFPGMDAAEVRALASRELSK